MGPQREVWELAGICVAMILLSLGGLVWAFLAGLLYPQILLDGLLLVLVCLLMGGVFAIMLFQVAKQQGWLARLTFPRRKTQPVEAPAPSPADPPRAGN